MRTAVGEKPPPFVFLAIPNNSNTHSSFGAWSPVHARARRADRVARKLESLARPRDIGWRDAGNVLGLCTGNPLDEVEAELRGVRDAVSVDDSVDDVERRELLPEVRGELLFAGFRVFVIPEGKPSADAVYKGTSDRRKSGPE